MVNKENSNNIESQLLEAREKQKKKKRRRKITGLVFFLLIVACGIFIYSFYMQEKRLPWQEKQVVKEEDKFRKTTVKETVYTSQIDLSGYVEAYETQTVMIRATGAVTGVFVKEGDRVKKGDLLATIDDTDQAYDVANIEQQLETAKIGNTASEREIKLLEMRLESAKQKLENTRAYANFDGVVVSVNIEEGDYFEAGSTTIMKIIDDSCYKATVEIDEIDFQLLEKGMKAVLTCDSVPGKNIEAYVSYIPMIGRYSSQGIGVVDVEIIIENPPEGLKPGFSFEGTIDVTGEQKMLLVSQSAVTIKRGVSTVTKLLPDGSMQTVTVQLKYLGENQYQVLGGDLKDGDVLVYAKTEGGIQGMMRNQGTRTGGAGK